MHCLFKGWKQTEIYIIYKKKIYNNIELIITVLLPFQSKTIFSYFSIYKFMNKSYASTLLFFQKQKNI